MLHNDRIGRVVLMGLLATLGLSACGGDDGDDDDGTGAGGEGGGNTGGGGQAGGGAAGGDQAGGGAGGGGQAGGGGTGGTSSTKYGCCVNGSGYSCPSAEAASTCNASVCTPDKSQCGSSSDRDAGTEDGGSNGGDGSAGGGGTTKGPCAGKSENQSCINDWGVQGYCCESFNSDNQSIGLGCWEDPC